MTVRDLLLTSEDVDIANDVTDALFPALCPPLYLTPEGEEHFARALDIPVELDDGVAVLLIDGESWKASYRAAWELFTAGAGRKIDQELELPEGSMGACYLCLIRQAYEPELAKLEELVDMIQEDDELELKLKDQIALRRYKLAL